MKNMGTGRSYLLLTDIVCLILSYVSSGWIRFGFHGGEWRGTKYGLVLMLLLLCSICLFSWRDDNGGLFRRGFFEEFVCVFRNGITLAAVTMISLFLLRQGSAYSRVFFTCLFFFYVVITYIGRQYLKVVLLAYYKRSGSSKKVVILSTFDRVPGILLTMGKEREWEYQVTGLVLADRDITGDIIEGIPVIAGIGSIYDTLAHVVVDEVFISVPADSNIDIGLDDMIEELEGMGITVRLNIMMFGLRVQEKTIMQFAGFHVLTFSSRMFKQSSLLLKRMLDIFGALMGLLLTTIITFFVAPAILIESRGPLFFSQTRVGKNGRRFRIYKFRSMYRDAEERRKELEGQNEMKGLMFKMTDDPRITRVGKWIRKTSIDELPQFLNVLKGDMSLVGTRPPTEDEFLQYEGRHKRRLQMKPGITGLWQASGRSDVENFEDVVKMDLEYIDSWSFVMDLKLLLKTVIVVLFRVGAK